ncbi:MAG: stage II sporulation protein E [Clostridia bacterium]|nr:stage II sporulation protein E [Clostridia bacterium]
MKTDILPYQRLVGLGAAYGKEKGKSLLNLVLTKGNVIVISLAFLLGRASIAGSIMPFGTALYASTMGTNVNRIITAVSVVFGMLTAGAREQIYVTIAGMLLFNAFNIPFKNHNRSRINFRYAVIGFVSTLLPEMVMVYLQGFLLFDLLKALFHGFIVFSLMFIFRNALPFITDTKRNGVLSNEELISLSIITALALSGLSDFQLFGFSMKNVLCVLLILSFSYKCGSGVGSAIGVTMGLIVSMSSTATPLIIGSYALCGLLAGVFRHLGKIGSCLGFVMGNTVLTLYMNGSVDVIIFLKEIVLSIFVFMLIPNKLLEKVMDLFSTELVNSPDKISYSERMKELTVEKLNKFSRSFKELSKTFSEISETKVVTEKQDISSLIDRVADKVCKDCSLCLHCWDRNFYNTYQVMFKVIEKLDNKGRVDESDIPEYFINKCERVVDFVKAINNAYEIFKVDMVWKSKIGESRELVSQQLEGLSNVVSNLAAEINMNVRFRADLEDIILSELKKAGIKASDAVVIENKWGKYEISIFHKGCGGKRDCISNIEKIVSNIAGRKMVKEEPECHQRLKNNLCTLKLVERESYRVTTGVAKVSKYDGTVSGDSYTFMNTGEGKYIVAISDGMGTGQKAATQSRATINLLEQFMESGFDKETTIKMINSILVLKSSDDSFTTIDLSIIDLHEGEIEFVKIGAVPTYIKKAEKVEAIKSFTLPVGILENVEMELVHKKIESGDFIIMMSDGVVDSFNRKEDADTNLPSFIEEIKSINSQEIADSILDKAYENCDGRPIDDMMVVVAKVWKSGNV